MAQNASNHDAEAMPTGLEQLGARLHVVHGTARRLAPGFDPRGEFERRKRTLERDILAKTGRVIRFSPDGSSFHMDGETYPI